MSSSLEWQPITTKDILVRPDDRQGGPGFYERFTSKSSANLLRVAAPGASFLLGQKYVVIDLATGQGQAVSRKLLFACVGSVLWADPDYVLVTPEEGRLTLTRLADGMGASVEVGGPLFRALRIGTSDEFLVSSRSGRFVRIRVDGAVSADYWFAHTIQGYSGEEQAFAYHFRCTDAGDAVVAASAQWVYWFDGWLKPLWRQDASVWTGARHRSSQRMGPVAVTFETPVQYVEQLYISPDGASAYVVHSGILAAFDPSGRVLWRQGQTAFSGRTAEGISGAWLSPSGRVILTSDCSGRFAILGSDGQVYARGATDGEVRISNALFHPRDEAIGVVGGDGQLYIVGMDGKIVGQRAVERVRSEHPGAFFGSKNLILGADRLRIFEADIRALYQRPVRYDPAAEIPRARPSWSAPSGFVAYAEDADCMVRIDTREPETEEERQREEESLQLGDTFFSFGRVTARDRSGTVLWTQEVVRDPTHVATNPQGTYTVIGLWGRGLAMDPCSAVLLGPGGQVVKANIRLDSSLQDAGWEPAIPGFRLVTYNDAYYRLTLDGRATRDLAAEADTGTSSALDLGGDGEALALVEVEKKLYSLRRGDRELAHFKTTAGIGAASLVAQDRVVALAGKKTLICVDLSGAELWKLNLEHSCDAVAFLSAGVCIGQGEDFRFLNADGQCSWEFPCLPKARKSVHVPTRRRDCLLVCSNGCSVARLTLLDIAGSALWDTSASPFHHLWVASNAATIWVDDGRQLHAYPVTVGS